MKSTLRIATILCLIIYGLWVPAPASAASEPPAQASFKPADAVIKVFSTSRLPDPLKPWTKQAPRQGTGSGVVIEGNRILTNAHVVSYASQVQIQTSQSGEKFEAHVVAIAPGIDLAVLQLEDESFFKSHMPLPRANRLPSVKDEVLAYGFPMGGSALSITKGIVSRIEFTRYYNYVSGLRIQIDAALNPGNSGGPVLADGQMIGLAFSGASNAQNIGYIIPTEEIELFLKDIADGDYDGKPTLLEEYQTLDNPAVRGFLKLAKGVKGIVVHRPFRSEPTYPLKEWDVITAVSGTPVDDQGMFMARDDLRLGLGYLVQKSARDNKVSMSIIRNGQPMNIELPLMLQRPLLIPALNNSYPSYFIYGPLVLSKASSELVNIVRNNAATLANLSYIGNPLATERAAAPDALREELVAIASPLFPHKLGTGYSKPQYLVVKSVNGILIRSLRHLVSVLRDMKDEFVAIATDNQAGETMVFPHRDMLAAVDEILADNGLRAQGSPDMLEIWRDKAPR